MNFIRRWLARRAEREFDRGHRWAMWELISGRLTAAELPFHLDGTSDDFRRGAMKALQWTAELDAGESK